MIYENEKLSKYNWFNLGGPARIFFKPNSQLDLKNFLEKHGSEEKNVYILGAGSNTLFRDSGFDGVIIKLGKTSRTDCNFFFEIKNISIFRR